MAPTLPPHDPELVPIFRHTTAPTHSSRYPIPRPLKIFKRTAREPGKFAPPLADLSRPIEGTSLAEALDSDHGGRPSPLCTTSAPSIGAFNTLGAPTESASNPDLYSPKSDHDLKSGPQNLSSRAPPPVHQVTRTPSIHYERLPPLSILPPRPAILAKTHSLAYSIYCSLCNDPLSTLQIYTFPKTAPAITNRLLTLYPGLKPEPTFCANCFESIHKMHICWGCGLRVHRREEKVGCGWAWWHWGCLGCLLCRVQPLKLLHSEIILKFQTPLPPPPWTDRPITLPKPPACKACTRSLRELTHIERVRKQADSPVCAYDNDRNRRLNVSTTRTASMSSSRNVSLGVKYPPLPKWMEKLPRAQGSGSIALGGNGVYSSNRIGGRKIGESGGVRKLSWTKRVTSLRRSRTDGVVVGAAGIIEGAGSVSRGFVGRRLSMPKWMERSPGNRMKGGGLRV